jgi:hypothetical protein
MTGGDHLSATVGDGRGRSGLARRLGRKRAMRGNWAEEKEGRR